MNTLKHVHSYIQLFFYLTAILTLTLTVQSLVICHLNITKASHLVLGTSYLSLSDPIFALASLFSQTQIWLSDLSTEYSFIAPIVFRVKFKLSVIKVLCDPAPAYHIIYLQFPYVGHVLFRLQPFVHASVLIYNVVLLVCMCLKPNHPSGFNTGFITSLGRLLHLYTHTAFCQSTFNTCMISFLKTRTRNNLCVSSTLYSMRF